MQEARKVKKPDQHGTLWIKSISNLHPVQVMIYLITVCLYIFSISTPVCLWLVPLLSSYAQFHPCLLEFVCIYMYSNFLAVSSGPFQLTCGQFHSYLLFACGQLSFVGKGSTAACIVYTSTHRYIGSGMFQILLIADPHSQLSLQHLQQLTYLNT